MRWDYNFNRVFNKTKNTYMNKRSFILTLYGKCNRLLKYFVNKCIVNYDITILSEIDCINIYLL